MSSPIYVTPPTLRLPDGAPPAPPATVDLLRQLVDLQTETVRLLAQQAAANDQLARWRALLGRWQGEFPDVGQRCRQVLPAVERAFLGVVAELTDKLTEEADGLDADFALSEFLDRYAVRLNQLGVVLSQLGPLADAAPPADGPTA